jgi:hypothetical protein
MELLYGTVTTTFTKLSTVETTNLQATKYAAPSSPIKPPMSGKRYTCSAEVKTKSSFPPTGMIVRKASKSLKVFIAFIFDIYPIHSSNRI